MSKVKKVTYSLPAELVAGVQEAVELGEAASQSAVVRDALTEYLARARGQRLVEAYTAAAGDPDFLRDAREVMRDLEHADAENWPDP